MLAAKLRLLAIDDSKENLDALGSAIPHAFPGAALYTAASGEEGLALALQKEPDVILLDLVMPGLDGFGTCRRLKEDPRTCDIPVIFLTAVSPDKATCDRAFEAGAEAFASKPFELWELAVQIRAMRKIKAANLLQREESARLKDMVERRTSELAGELAAHEKALEALKESEALFKAVFTESPIGICVVSEKNGRFLSANPALSAILGRTPEELLGTACWDITHPEDVRRQKEQLSLLRGGRAGVLRMETRYIRKDGSATWVKLTLSALPAFNNSEVRYIGLVEDIESARNYAREKSQLEEQLRQAQKMEIAGRLAGGVAHDFNNILSAILAYSDFLLKKLAPGDQRRSDAEEIKKAGLRAANLTKQLLTFSRKQKLQPVVLDLNSLIKDMKAMLRRLLGEDIELETLTAAEEAPIKADPGYIEQVILNLAVNARDAMPKGGRLLIQSSLVRMDTTYMDRHGTLEPGDYALLSVSDTGSGMSEEIKSHIFEPFFTTKPRNKGTGLGLSTVHGIVRQSGGVITLYSEKGRGTIFKIYFPLASESGAAAPRQPRKELPAAAGTVLVVDDDEQIRALARRTLADDGLTVLEAASAEEALALFERRNEGIDLLLTDMVLPRMSGPDLEKNLKNISPHMETIYMSGYTEHTVLDEGPLDPEKSFIQKPFTLESLTRKAREALARSAARKA